MSENEIESKHKWWVLAAMTTTVSMVFIDVSVLPVALPTMQRDLGLSNLSLQWIINAYTLILACFVLAGGKIGDRWGLKKAFCAGVVIFSLSSAMCGLGNRAWWLILARSVQGLGGALLIPATQGIILSHFPPHQRGRALGIFVSVGSVFMSLGPLVGGALTTYLSWRYVFWINLPIAAIGLCLALLVVPAMPGKKEIFDFRGFLILIFAMGMLVIGLMQVQSWGWLSAHTLILFCTGLILAIFLFLRKHKSHATIVDFDLFKKRQIVAGLTTMSATQFITMAAVFWAIYFQNVLGFSPNKAGIYAFMANIPVLAAAPLGGYLVDHFGPRRPTTIGFSLICFALIWFFLFQNHEEISLLIPTLLCFGFGCALIYSPSMVSIMNDVPPEKRGNASGMIATARQFSASLGLALFGTFYSVNYIKHLQRSLDANPSTSFLSAKQLEGVLSEAPDAIKALEKLPSNQLPYLVGAAKEAFLQGLAWINLTAATIAFCCIIFSFMRMSNRPAEKQPDPVQPLE